MHACVLRGVEYPGTRITGGCELSDVDAGNQI